MARIVGVQHAVATASGTAALHLAMVALGIGPGDEVLMPALTFIAPANAVRYTGAWPTFLDVDPDTWQLDARRLERFLDRECDTTGGVVHNRVTGRAVRAVLPVHLLGHPCEIDGITELARAYGLYVIEDATESLGATFDGAPLGGFGDVGCFSFNGNKTVTAGGGGVLATRDEGIARRVRYLSTQAKDEPDEYVHREIGFNYRLTNLQAAVAVAQLAKLDELVGAKRRIAARYAEAFADTGIGLLEEPPRACSVFWLSTARIDPTRCGTDRRALRETLGAHGIEARPLWQPLHRSPAHAASMHDTVEVADRVYAEALSLPSSVGLEASQQDRVIGVVLDAVTTT